MLMTYQSDVLLALCRLSSLVTWPIVQYRIHFSNKWIKKALHYWPFALGSSCNQWFPIQRASKTESFSIFCHLYGKYCRYISFHTHFYWCPIIGIPGGQSSAGAGVPWQLVWDYFLNEVIYCHNCRLCDQTYLHILYNVTNYHHADNFSRTYSHTHAHTDVRVC